MLWAGSTCWQGTVAATVHLLTPTLSRPGTLLKRPSCNALLTPIACAVLQRLSALSAWRNQRRKHGEASAHGRTQACDRRKWCCSVVLKIQDRLQPSHVHRSWHGWAASASATASRRLPTPGQLARRSGAAASRAACLRHCGAQTSSETAKTRQVPALPVQGHYPGAACHHAVMLRDPAACIQPQHVPRHHRPASSSDQCAHVIIRLSRRCLSMSAARTWIAWRR